MRASRNRVRSCGRPRSSPHGATGDNDDERHGGSRAIQLETCWYPERPCSCSTRVFCESARGRERDVFPGLFSLQLRMNHGVVG